MSARSACPRCDRAIATAATLSAERLEEVRERGVELLDEQ